MEIKFGKRIKQKKLGYLSKSSKKAHVDFRCMRGPCEVIHQPFSLSSLSISL